MDAHAAALCSAVIQRTIWPGSRSTGKCSTHQLLQPCWIGVINRGTRTSYPSKSPHGMFGQAGCGSLRHASSVDWFVVLRQSCLSTTVAAFSASTTPLCGTAGLTSVRHPRAAVLGGPLVSCVPEGSFGACAISWRGAKRKAGSSVLRKIRAAERSSALRFRSRQPTKPNDGRATLHCYRNSHARDGRHRVNSSPEGAELQFPNYRDDRPC